MFTWLARSLDEDPSADLAGQFSRDDLSNKARGLTDSLDGRRRALAVTDITELLSISERQVYKLVAAHRIPCSNELKVRRLGRRVLVPRRPLESLMHRATDRSSGQRLWFQECFEHLGAFRQVG